MSGLSIQTYDSIPDGPRCSVRDMRLCCACEKAGLTCTVQSVPFDGREMLAVPWCFPEVPSTRDNPDQLTHFAAADAARQ